MLLLLLQLLLLLLLLLLVGWRAAASVCVCDEDPRKCRAVLNFADCYLLNVLALEPKTLLLSRKWPLQQI
jgi:hypothetical protein